MKHMIKNMNRKYLVLFAFAAALTGCAKDSEMTESPVNPIKSNTETVAKQPVLFGAYVNRATTRAGDPGVLVTSGATAGQINLQEKGFGVISYYTDDDMYSPIYQPNFMYNTKVTHNGSAWTYEPVQYWPNETGENAVSEGVDRLSFFAYAPYVDVTPSTGVVTGDDASGIVGLSRNAAVGDPWVKYYVSLDPAKQVDFSWAVPQINMVKPNVTDVVNMQFNHALAALNVQVDAMIDESTPGNNTLDADTKIYVRSVTFEGLVTKGSFNLNSTKAIWYDLAGANYIDGGSVTVYDGRTNGKEGQSESANESPLGLNPVLVQSQPYSGTPTAGVTNAAVNLFAGTTADAPIYVIPSGQPLTVTIVYDVETATDELAGYLSDGETHGTSVENKITKSISFGTSNKLEAGKLYKLTLHLGMTSVKFDATVAEWDESTDNGEAGLPDNIGTAPGPGPTPGPGSAPAGTSGGLFSVSATKKVYIATSNLMWEGNLLGGTYKLMEYPWSMIETASSTITANYGISNTNTVQVGLFGWGTPDLPYMTANVWQEYASNGFVDWGTMYGDGKWRVLTYDEFIYLLTQRTNAFGFATVNNVHGLVLAPDGFTTPTGVSYTRGLANKFDTNIYTAEQWELMQGAGAVFLPAAGHRDPNHSNNIINAGNDLWYWLSTSSINTPTSDQLLYDEEYNFTISADYRYYGSSVRLVYDKEDE